MEVYWDDGYWAAEFPDLPGLAAGHEDRSELWSAVDDARRAYFEAALLFGRTVPRPRTHEDGYSGNPRLRLAKSSHRQAALAAQQEAISLTHLAPPPCAADPAQQDGAGWGPFSRPKAPQPVRS